MLRTFTNEDGAFIHCGDLATSLRRQGEEYGGEVQLAFDVIAKALEAIETETLRRAIAKRPLFFGLRV